MVATPFYDPQKSYEENYETGPYGAFAEVLKEEKNGGIIKQKDSSNARSEYAQEKVKNGERGQADAHFGHLNPNQKKLAGEMAGASMQAERVEWLGQSLRTPFGIPAGPLLNARFCEAAFKMGFDVCVYKTVRTQFQACHPAPNVLPLALQPDELTTERAREVVVTKSDYSQPLSITNSFGVPSRAPEEWQPDMAAAVKVAGSGQVLVGSFQGTKKAGGTARDFIEDYVTAATLVQETGAKVLEANLSCPNEGSGNLVCFDVQTVVSIAGSIKQAIGDTPLILKLAYFDSESHLRELVKSVGGIVQGFAAINTIPATVETPDGQQALPGAGRAVSGVCGAAIRWNGLDMTKRLVQLREEMGLEYSVIGVGGVMEADDFHLFKEAGADVVMSATGAMWDPYLAQKIAASNN